MAVFLGERVKLFAAGVPPEVLRRIKENADAVARAPNFWIGKDDLEAETWPRDVPMTEAEHAVRMLYRRVVRRLLPQNGEWAGAEFWVQAYRPGRGLAFHMDKDEALMRSQGLVVTPIFSSVLYLTGGFGEGELPQGPTVVIDQEYDNATKKVYPDNPTACVLVWPRAAHYCVFDGALGHGVLDTCSQVQRVTFLVNWWRTRPQEVHKVTAFDIEKYKLAVHVQPSEQPGGSQTVQTASSSGTAATPPKLTAAKQLPIKTLPVPDDLYLVDDVVRHYGLTLRGPKAIAAAIFMHGGGEGAGGSKRVLFPLDISEQRRKTGNRKLVYDTLALLVPLEALEGDTITEVPEEEWEEECENNRKY